MQDFDFQSFFTGLQFSREQAVKLATFLTRCLELGAAAGVGFGGVAYAEASQRGDQRAALATGLTGFLVMGGAVYLTCRAVRSRILDIIAEHSDLPAAALAQILTPDERRQVLDEAQRLLRMDPGRLEQRSELMA